MIATTLAGYVGGPLISGQPDLKLVSTLVRRTSLPVIAEGRYSTPEQVRAAFEAGAAAVVVGKAITSPAWLTRRFTMPG